MGKCVFCGGSMEMADIRLRRAIGEVVFRATAKGEVCQACGEGLVEGLDMLHFEQKIDAYFRSMPREVEIHLGEEDPKCPDLSQAVVDRWGNKI